MNVKLLLIVCVIVNIFASCHEKSERQSVRLYLTHVGFDSSSYIGGECSIYPYEMYFQLAVENYTDSILIIKTFNHQFIPERGKEFGYFQWIVDNDTLDLYSRGTYIQVEPVIDDNIIIGLGDVISTQDSVLMSKFNIEDRNDSLEIKNNLESLIQRSRMRFIPIPEDYIDFPKEYMAVNYPIEIDLSSFSFVYLLDGRGSFNLEYDQGQIYYKGWTPDTVSN